MDKAGIVRIVVVMPDGELIELVGQTPENACRSYADSQQHPAATFKTYVIKQVMYVDYEGFTVDAEGHEYE